MQYLFMNLIHGPHFMADSRVVLDSVIGKADGIHCKYHFPNTWTLVPQTSILIHVQPNVEFYHTSSHLRQQQAMSSSPAGTSYMQTGRQRLSYVDCMSAVKLC